METNRLDLSALPDLPQRELLVLVAQDFWHDPETVALWLGGSLARGAGDAYSDVDLRVAVRPDAFDPQQLPRAAKRLAAAEVARLNISFGDDAVLHHMLLADGQIYDLFVQTSEREPGNETRLTLSWRDAAFGAKLAGGADPTNLLKPADPQEIREVLCSFWLNQQKHLKVLSRGLTLMAWEGEHRLRQDLLRLYYVLATGNDCGSIARLTIHPFTPVVQAVQEAYGDEALRLLGQPLSTVEELLSATEHSRDEFARVGKLLSEKLGFDYPDDAEQTVRRSWKAFQKVG